jgi:hypothetical protein
LKAETEGKATVFMPSHILPSLVKAYGGKKLRVEFKHGYLMCETSSIGGIRIMDYGEHEARKAVALPINFGERDVLRLGVTHDKAYLRANHLTGKVEAVKKQKMADIDKAWRLLSKYGVKSEDLEDLVVRVVFGPFE